MPTKKATATEAGKSKELGHAEANSAKATTSGESAINASARGTRTIAKTMNHRMPAVSGVRRWRMPGNRVATNPTVAS